MLPHLSFILLPFTRLEVPGWGKLAKIFKVDGAEFDPLWKDAPTKIIRGKWHDNTMKLDLSDWSDRSVYFLGRYFELDVSLILKAILNKGDRFVDVGANTGMLTLHGAALVGNSGCVDSFEPNPHCVARIQEDLRRNEIRHVHLHQAGLSDEQATLTLNVAHGSSGLGTFATPRSSERELFTQSIEVPVMIGDTVLMQNPTPVKLIKIDVEGFELHVLRGFEKTLSLWHPIIVTEFVDEWLTRAGASRVQLYEFMSRFGYTPFGISTRRKVFHHKLLLTFLRAGDIEKTDFKDVLWIHPFSFGWPSLAHYVDVSLPPEVDPPRSRAERKRLKRVMRILKKWGNQR
jgi:FkbM family methyltransferase